MAWAVQFPGVPGWSSQESSDKTRLCWYQQEQLKQHIRGCGCRQWCPWCYSQFNCVTQGNTWPSAETESLHAFHRTLAECAACAGPRRGPQNDTCITDRTEGEIPRDESASPATLTAALRATVSAGGEDKEKVNASSHSGPLPWHGQREAAGACTWMGDTAAAGGVRTGIPLRGLRREECSCTAAAAPSGFTTQELHTTESQKLSTGKQTETSDLHWSEVFSTGSKKNVEPNFVILKSALCIFSDALFHVEAASDVTAAVKCVLMMIEMFFLNYFYY